MNEWLIAACGLLVLLAPAGLLAMRGGLFERIVAMQLASLLAVIALVLLAEGFDRDVYYDLAIVTAALDMAGTLFFLRIVESRL